MDKIESLINKLSYQYKTKADFSQMQFTIMLLQQEINGAMSSSGHLGSENVSVFIPKTVHNPLRFNFEEKDEKETFNLALDAHTIQTLNEGVIDKDELPNEAIPDLETIKLFIKEEAEKPQQPVKNPVLDYNIFLPLFKENQILMDRSIKAVQKYTKPEEALEWLDNELAKKLSWNLEDSLVLRFYKTIIDRLD